MSAYDTCTSDVVIDRFRGPYRALSNFFLAPVYIYDWAFPSVEHAFQAMKCADPATGWPAFVDPKLSASGAKARGHAVPMRGDWERVKTGFMRALVFDKFSRHSALRVLLLSTAPAYLIEGNNHHDNVWGDCCCGRPACAARGQNRLGRILMEVRQELTPV